MCVPKPFSAFFRSLPVPLSHFFLRLFLDIASFLNVTPKTISKIRKEITFGKD